MMPNHPESLFSSKFILNNELRHTSNNDDTHTPLLLHSHNNDTFSKRKREYFSTTTTIEQRVINSHQVDVEVQGQEDNDIHQLSAHTVIQEARILIKISNPVVLTYMLQYSLQTGSVLIVGRLGSQELAASVFAFMFAMITGWLLGLGGSTALELKIMLLALITDTLGSQLWGASNDKPYLEKRREMNILLQRTCIVLNICFIPVAILWYFVEPILLLLGQDALLCQMVQEFLRYAIPGTPAYIGFEAIKRYLQAQGILPHASTFTLMMCSPLNILMTYLFVHTLDFGFIGAPIASSLTHWVMLLVLIGIMCIFGDNNHKEAKWQLLTIHREAFKQWKEFFGFAIPGIISLGSEYAAFELVTVLVGLLDSSTTMAAQSIVIIADDILCTVPLGISVATTTRVGYWLGRGLHDHAKMAAIVSTIIAFSIGIISSIVLLATKDTFGFLFSENMAVIELVSKILPYLAIFQMVDGVAGASGGALRGSCCQHWSASLNLIGYYAFALPLGAFLSFGSPQLGLSGLWAALCSGLLAISLIQTIMLLRMNWRHQVEVCTLRFHKQ